MINIDQIRNDTPACKDKLFFDSAGASLVPSIVSKTVTEYLDAESKIGGYKLADLRREQIYGFRTEGAKLLNTQARNVIFAPSATGAFGLALSSIPFEKEDVILTSNNDYISNFLQYIWLEKRFGVETIRINSLDNGDLDLSHLEALIKSNPPRLVALTHIPTNSGLVQDVVSAGKICKKHNILYLVDACQSFGQMPVDVQEIQCDFLSVNGRKFMRGPRGTGLLFVADTILEKDFAPLTLDASSADWTAPNAIRLRSDASRFGLFETPVAFLLGLKAAMAYANEVGLDNIRDYNSQLRERLTANLSTIPGIRQLDMGSYRSNIITFVKEGMNQAAMTELLDKHDVYYSVSRRGSALIDFDKKGLDWAIRFSPHYFNTLEEMDRVAEILS